MSVRAFHLEPVPSGHCRWCADPITSGRKDRAWHDGRGEEADCAYEYRLHTRRDDQFAYVERRDGLRCWDCGAEPAKWRYPTHNGVAITCRTMRVPWSFPDEPRVQYVGSYCPVERVTALELEHTVPLWSTTHLPWAERRKYFGPENLRLLCPEKCHAAKTRRETTTRAKEKRQAKKLGPNSRTADGQPVWRRSKRKLQSRGFDKSHTRRMNGDVVDRRPK